MNKKIFQKSNFALKFSNNLIALFSKIGETCIMEGMIRASYEVQISKPNQEEVVANNCEEYCQEFSEKEGRE
jgi:hypothetical protein